VSLSAAELRLAVAARKPPPSPFRLVTFAEADRFRKTVLPGAVRFIAIMAFPLRGRSALPRLKFIGLDGSPVNALMFVLVLAFAPGLKRALQSYGCSWWLSKCSPSAATVENQR
jgi:hypothetical protein